MIRPNLHLLLAISAAAAAVTLTVPAQAITIYGLGSGGQLYSFDTATPGTVNPIGSATVGGLVDIDFRGANNRLYGMTSSGAASTINTSNGVLTSVFANTSIPITGGVTSFDFNPVADRFRVVGGGINNYRVFPDGLAMPAGTVVGGAADGTFATPASVTLLDVAYTNPFNNTSTGMTTLFSIGSNSVLYTHPAAGGPTFNMVSAIGSLGITVGSDIAFDIDSTGTGWLVDGTSLYTVNLTTGLAAPAGTLGQSLTSIAVVPEPSSAIVLVSTAGLFFLRRRRTI
ncbi:MAG: DUF4394 domain-containing protein [Verrucomicrobiaceae bacterium]|nr:MAG: DUF4394 domain-containing protein [Verrucomicrobiaceae bacterium]